MIGLCISESYRSQKSKLIRDVYFDTGLEQCGIRLSSVPNRCAVMGNILPNALSKQVLNKRLYQHLSSINFSTLNTIINAVCVNKDIDIKVLLNLFEADLHIYVSLK